MKVQLSILPVLDEQVVNIFEQLVKLIPGIQNPVYSWKLGDEGSTNCGLQEFPKQPAIEKILHEHAEIFAELTLNFTISQAGPQSGNLSILRDQNGETRVTLNLPQYFDRQQQEVKVALVAALRTAFQPYARSNVLREFHPVVDEFYRRMNDTTIRLMQLNESVTRENEEFRRGLEAKNAELKLQLEAEYKGRLSQLEATCSARQQDLDKRENALTERQKELDDRDNTHARRQKQEDLNKKLQSYQASFGLTQDTTHKRAPVTYAFLAGLVFSACSSG